MSTVGEATINELELLNKRDRKSYQVWRRRFKDGLGFLNARDEEVRQAAKADPRPGPDGWRDTEIDLLNRLRRAFQILYRFTAEGRQDDRRFARASDTVAEIFSTEMPGFRPGRFVGIDGATYIRTDLSDLDQQPQRRGITLVGHVFPCFINEIELHLIRASASTIFVCTWCGEIGLCSQRNRRFCSDRCRMAAHREKERIDD